MSGIEILRRPWAGYAATFAATALLTVLTVPFREEVGLLNEGLLFVLLTLFVASVWGRNTGLFASVITNLSLNFFFIEPYHTFNVDDPKNIGGLLIFWVVSLIGGSLLSMAREAAGQAGRRQAETEVALTLSRAMSGQRDPDEALEALCQEVVRAFDAPGAAVLTGSDARWSLLAHAGVASSAREPDAEERAAAERAVSEGTVQSFGGTGLSRNRARIVFPPGRRAAYQRDRSFAVVLLKVGDRVLGVLRLDGPIGKTPFRDHPEQLLSAVASEAALAVQRAELAQAAGHAQALEEADELKTALLNAVSHDLRTPLASIIASAESLQQTDVSWTAEERQDFAEAIEHEAQRLDGVVGNLLDLSRIESGSLRPDKDFYDLGSLIYEVIGRLKTATADRDVKVLVPTDLPPVPLDYIEIEEVLMNLLENASKYTPPRTPIELSVERRPEEVLVRVSDRGPGLPTDALKRVFEPFFRANGGRVKGTGLGLAVAKGLVEAHGGRIWAENKQEGGTNFSFTLPTPGSEEATSPNGRIR
jgi:two-component system sensor histidine kinase KdpD